MHSISAYQQELEREFRAAYLIGGFIQENLSEEEEEELERWILTSERNLQIFEDLTDESAVEDYLRWYFERDVEANLLAVKKRISFGPAPKKYPRWYLSVAASILILLGVAGYFFLTRKDTEGKAAVVAAVPLPDILPGTETARLKIGEHTIIDLGKVTDSVISEALHIEHGRMVYTDTATAPVDYELSIPRKGFYQFSLPDGSKVWVNSASSIRYPSRFTGPERRVSVTGETYFEVAKDAAHPFIVTVEGAEIKALGTAFSINAYTNENGIKATLTEGKIEVSKGGMKNRLEPGQQLLITTTNQEIRQVDVLQYTAWTRDQFRFKNASIEEIMRMVERWYDARIIYQDKIADHFTGTISRSVPVSRLLQLLEATGQVHFTIQGNTINVSIK